MNKGKGLPSDLRSRRNTKVSINLDEEQLWEDDMLSKAEAWMCVPQDGRSRMLSLLHIEEYFNYFLAQTRLEGFASHPQKTYAKIS
jgi:hypothetical protein